MATRSKKLLVAPGLTTRNKKATSGMKARKVLRPNKRKGSLFEKHVFLFHTGCSSASLRINEGFVSI